MVPVCYFPLARSVSLFVSLALSLALSLSCSLARSVSLFVSLALSLAGFCVLAHSLLYCNLSGVQCCNIGVSLAFVFSCVFFFCVFVCSLTLYEHIIPLRSTSDVALVCAHNPPHTHTHTHAHAQDGRGSQVLLRFFFLKRGLYCNLSGVQCCNIGVSLAFVFAFVFFRDYGFGLV